MGDTVIPLADLRYLAPVPRIPDRPIAASGMLSDQLGRPLRDLRISVTDRCNFRCSYCMPKDVFDRDYVFLPQTSLLSFEEIARLACIFVAHGQDCAAGSKHRRLTAPPGSIAASRAPAARRWPGRRGGRR